MKILKLISYFIEKIQSLKKKGFFYLLFAMLLGQGVSFVQRIFLGRWLSQEDFGRYSLIVESSIFFTALITLALPTAMIRFGLKEKKLDFYFAGTFKIFFYLTIFAIATYFILRLKIQFFNDKSTQFYVDLAVVLSPFLAFFNYVVSYLSANKKILERAIITLLQRISSFVFIIGGCWIALWIGTISGYFTILVVFGVGLIIRFRRLIFIHTDNFPYKQVIGFSVWNSLSIAGIGFSFILILNYSERILIELTLISQLTIAFTFTIIAKIFFASVNGFLFPYFMEKKTKKEFVQLLWKVIVLLLFLSVIILLISYGIIPFVITLLLGSKYVAAIPIFKIVIIGEIIVGFSLVFEMILEIFGAVKFKAIALGIDLMILLLILKPLLKTFGIYGAVYSFLLYSFLRLLICLTGSVYCLVYFPQPVAD